MHVAIVTGAGSGIGRATAFKLAAAGYRVALVGRTSDTLKLVEKTIQETGGQAMTAVADVASAEQVLGMVRTVISHWGGVDVLVNNAGAAPEVHLADLTGKQWREVIDVNLTSAVLATQAVWQSMAERGGGVVVNVSSMASVDPYPALGVYGIAKAGVNMLTLVTGREGKASKIRAVGISPGAVETGMFRKLSNIEGIPAARILRPDEVADSILEAIQGVYPSGTTVLVYRGGDGQKVVERR